MVNVPVKVERSTYRVHSFVNEKQETLTSKSKATVMLVSGVKGVMKGVCRPVGMSVARKLRLNVGDVFTETITYEKQK